MSLGDARQVGDDAGFRELKDRISDLESQLRTSTAALGGLQGLIDAQNVLAATSAVGELTFSFAAGFTGFHPDFLKMDKPAWATRALLIGGVQEVSNSLTIPDGAMREVTIVGRATADTSAPTLLEGVAAAESYAGFSTVHMGMFSLPTDASIWVRPSIVTDGSSGGGYCTLKVSIFAYWIKL